jgi:HSP20 family molecular chaperone IbpA
MTERDQRDWMWAEACALIGRAERLHRQFFQPRCARGVQPSWEPPADIFETEHDLWVMVALPGVEAERVEIHLDIRTVLLPSRNRKDFEDIPEDARRHLKFVWLDTVDDAAAAAIGQVSAEAD